MKRLITLLSIAMCMSVGVKAKSQVEDSLLVEDDFEYRKVENTAFKAGELLTYKLSYGIINAGVATLEVKKTSNKIQGREILHMVGIGNSISAFEWFYKVRDRYETYMDAEGMFPWLFIRRVNEGGYIIEQDYKFFQNKGKVKNEENNVYDAPFGIQDMLSSFYYARTLDFSNAKKGDIFEFVSFVDEEIYPIRIKYGGEKTIKIGKGKFDCLVFHPVVQEGRIFKSDEDLSVYITNDKNKIPVLAKAKVIIGSIRMELTDYKNLANPIAKR